MKIWIDDERPAPVGEWVHIHTYQEAHDWLSTPGHIESITRISFDHDLGSDKTGYDLACILEVADFEGKVPPGIEYTVHSANGPGRERIAKVLEKICGERWQSLIVDYIRLCHDEEEKLGGRG